MHAHRSEGIRRLRLVLGCLGSIVTFLYIGIGISGTNCGLSVFVGFEGCYTNDFLDILVLESVVTSSTFQAKPHADQVEFVRARWLRETQWQPKHYYQTLSVEQQRALAEKWVSKFPRQNRMKNAAIAWSLLLGLTGLGFLAPWGLVRVTAWMIAGFQADRASGERR